MSRSRIASAAAIAALFVAAAMPAEAADPANGKRIYARCAACHLIDASGRNTVGPNLLGVIGRAAGSVAKFRYSPAMAKAGIAWSAEKLDAYLANPRKLVPGTNMAFPGIPSATDRADVIAYMQSVR